ncbi:hypothetical protein [Anaerophaga thermohalophila]|uniref:hypothetical protein n=1 Tax=Anaerophaga thermohalophila TaxID=177400 RepID=UPI000237C669|nr:hypothetical protein [Anaerophaga thermohalophila]
MKNRFKLMSLLLAIGMAVSFSSCSDDDDDNNNTGDDTGNVITGNVIVTENITENTTWTSDKVYQLGGRITVEAGATLTIEPGTIIKGEAGTGANATALLIARGAKIMAEGTADAPIIFTSVADEISPEQVAEGNFRSPNLEPDINGLWGGVLVLGNARISASNEAGDISEVQIEGIPTSDTNGLYGGDDDEDNSGVLKYISIRHGGSNIGSGNEINGLTLGGVGSGTVIENVEIVSNQDDGIEWFGGTVNVKNAVVWNVGDDAIDADQSWTGTLDNFIVISPSDHNFELDGPEGSQDFGPYTIKNGVVIANSENKSSSDLINTDDNTSVHFDNIFITAIAEGQQINRVVHEVGDVVFANIVLDVEEAELPNHIKGDIVPEGITAGNAPASPIDTSLFGWTWAAQSGATNF